MLKPFRLCPVPPIGEIFLGRPKERRLALGAAPAAADGPTAGPRDCHTGMMRPVQACYALLRVPGGAGRAKVDQRGRYRKLRPKTRSGVLSRCSRQSTRSSKARLARPSSALPTNALRSGGVQGLTAHNAGLLAAAQAVEHEELGREDAVSLSQETLEEEKAIPPSALGRRAPGRLSSPGPGIPLGAWGAILGNAGKLSPLG